MVVLIYSEFQYVFQFGNFKKSKWLLLCTLNCHEYKNELQKNNLYIYGYILKHILLEKYEYFRY